MRIYTCIQCGDCDYRQMTDRHDYRHLLYTCVIYTKHVLWSGGQSPGSMAELDGGFTLENAAKRGPGNYIRIRAEGPTNV